MEPRQVGGGSSSEQRLPVVSVLTLWTPACRCRCGTKHRTAAAARLPQQPHSAQGRGATGPWGVGTGAAPSQTDRAWGWDRFWGAEWEGGSPWPRVNEAGQTPGRSKGCPERARAPARTGGSPGPCCLRTERRAAGPGWPPAEAPASTQPRRARGQLRRGHFPRATSRDPTLLPPDKAPCPAKA